MDPLSIAASAAALVTICVQTGGLIKTLAETFFHAEEGLLKLLSQIERLRLTLEQLRGLSQQLGAKADIALMFDDSAPRLTMNKLRGVIESIAGHKRTFKMQLMIRRSDIEALRKRLQEHEDDMTKVFVNLGTMSAIRTEAEIEKIRQDIARQAIAEPAFAGQSPSRSSGSSETLNLNVMGMVPISNGLQVWFGDRGREAFAETYLDLRDQLSDAAYSGQWESLLDVLDEAAIEYNESWVNASRLGVDANRSSGWTPLHQAVWCNASQEFVQLLVQRGAWRCLRTLWTNIDEGIPYKDVSPLELAKLLGYSHLFSILAPVIFHPLPLNTLLAIESRFHSLIREHVGEQDLRVIRLPELIVLTELQDPQMWFPLHLPQIGLRCLSRTRGYLYYLDGRELLVKPIGIYSRGDPIVGEYRISESAVTRLDGAIVFRH